MFCKFLFISYIRAFLVTIGMGYPPALSMINLHREETWMTSFVRFFPFNHVFFIHKARTRDLALVDRIQYHSDQRLIGSYIRAFEYWVFEIYIPFNLGVNTDSFIMPGHILEVSHNLWSIFCNRKWFKFLFWNKLNGQFVKLRITKMKIHLLNLFLVMCEFV